MSVFRSAQPLGRGRAARRSRAGAVLRDLLASGFTASSRDFEGYETVTKLIVVNIAALLGFTLCCTLLILRLASSRYPFLTFYALAALFFVLVILLLRKTKNVSLAAALVLLSSFAVLALDLYMGFLSESRLAILACYPLLACYLLGKRRGLFAITGLLVGYGGLKVFSFLTMGGAAPGRPFPKEDLVLFAVVAVLAYLIEDREERILHLMRERIYRDPLTGLPNRAMLLRQIAEARSPALLLLNIDDFKEINATYGYRTGDKVLQHTAERLKQIVPDTIVGVYHLEADEFAVLVNREEEDARFQKKLSHVASLVTRFLRHDKYRSEDMEIRIRTTMGIAVADEVGLGKLFASADLALQTAKGTNHPFLFYAEALSTKKRYEENLKWSNLLADALDSGRIVPYYQPIVSNGTGKIEKYECLVRLIDGEGRVIGPNAFLAIAKKSRLYSRITKTMLRKAVEFAKANPAGISINLCVEDLSEQTVLDYIDKVLGEHPSVRAQLCFEITESEGIENFEQVSDFIGKVKRWGCQVAIDDFGAGYSNFDYLTRLSVDFIKIDGSLIRGIHREESCRLIVEKIVAFTRQMGIKTIAEFVESEEILAQVRHMEIDCSQGYFLGEPRPASTEILA
jgi:diguanylate cyclase (GGDEF)-like protein